MLTREFLSELDKLPQLAYSCVQHQERFGKAESGYLPLEMARCLDPTGRCAGERSSEQKISTGIPPPDEDWRIFCALGANPSLSLR
jgi:hypothetical protein